MNVLFGNKSIECKHLFLSAGRVKVGDLIYLENGLNKVKTVQPACPHIENLSQYFCNILCEAPNGARLQVRPANKVEVFRPRHS